MWYTILLAGGSGTRMGAGINKVLLPLSGEAVLLRAAKAFEGLTDGMVVVCNPADEKAIRDLLDGKVSIPDIRFTTGGATRQDSVHNGMLLLPPACDFVMVHDGARPLTDRRTIEAGKASAERHGSGIAAIAVTDTVKEAAPDGAVLATPDRSRLRAVQTPQCFRRELLEQAHANAAAACFQGTDDASLVERLGETVYLTEGSRRNIKLTTAEDMAAAEAYLTEGKGMTSIRIGSGYDVHRLVENRKLILCGIDIPHEKGLLGHSDADVAVHALMDAMLGTLALGDIGQHFPDTDEQYRGISSLKLLQHVDALLKSRGASLVNCDITIAAQRPKLMPHIPMMRQNLAQVLKLPEDCVSVKATTTEHLAFEGREEGISARAVCLVSLNQ